MKKVDWQVTLSEAEELNGQAAALLDGARLLAQGMGSPEGAERDRLADAMQAGAAALLARQSAVIDAAIGDHA